MKVFKKALLWLTAVLPLIYTAAAVFFFLPETVAAHFNAAGKVDRYGSKYEAFILPAVILAVYLIYLLIKKITRGKLTDDPERVERNLGILDTVMTILLILLNAICVFILILMGDPSVASDPENLIYVIISAVVGILFIVLGNILPKTKPNALIGMRLSFCMDSDEHWHIANRAGGIAMVISGVVTVIAGLILRSFAYLFWMLGALLVTLTIAIIYSYVKIKGEKKS